MIFFYFDVEYFILIQNSMLRRAGSWFNERVADAFAPEVILFAVVIFLICSFLFLTQKKQKNSALFKACLIMLKFE